MANAEIYDKLVETYGNYHEGSEVGDAMEALRSAAYILSGINDYEKAVRCMLMVKSLVHNDLSWRRQENIENGLRDDYGFSMEELELLRKGE